MVFQDFDILQERRRQERQRKLKKRIIIAVVIFVLVGIAAAAAFAFISTKDSAKNEAKKSDNDGKKDDNKPKDNKPASTPANDKPPSTPPTTPANDKPSSTPPTNDKDGKKNDNKSKPSSVPKGQVASKEFVQSVCEGSTYKRLCAITLTKNLEKNPDSVKQPKQLVKSFITSTNDELDKALTKAGSIELKTEADKKAFGVCQELMGDAKDELQSTADKVEKIDPANLPTNGDLDTQLSAVMSYQEACVDSFSEGQTKNDFRTTFNTSQVYTSNSLAMVRQLATLRELSSKDNNNKPQAKRRLLQTGFPNWLNNEQRRLLKEEGGDEKSKKPTPNVTVAQDGSRKFKTISEALAAMPEKYDGRYVIFVKAGTYEENVNVKKKMVNLTIYGEGSQKSIITGSKNTADGIPPYLTASFVAAGRGFMAKSMGFRNTAGPDKQQALAARISSDRAILLNCRFEGYQNTLYVQTHRQFYRSCVIKGTMDFIFGDAASVFQNCEIYAMKPKDNQKNTITAQGRKDNFETTGIVIQNSKILQDESFKADAKKFKSYLGRPTKRYSRTIIMETQIEDFIDPAGWLELEGQKDFAVDTLFYGEFNNTGPGAKTQSRVKWAGRKDINKDEAMKYTVGTFLKGSWVKESGAPVRMELGS